MVYSRFPMKDPRTVARDIPGIFDVIFPQLTQGTVAYFNKKTVIFPGLKVLSEDNVQSSLLQKAMLFEIAFARGEQILNGLSEADWDDCLRVAIRRQRRHFDAQLPDEILPTDRKTADCVANNLAAILHHMKLNAPEYELIHSPKVPGYQWITSGEGDFSLGQTLIEVKCTSSNFGSADYRQVLMYWLLSYASAIEHNTLEWTSVTLLNPRKNYVVDLLFNEIVEVTAAGKSKIEILELFSSMVGDFALKALPEFKF